MQNAALSGGRAIRKRASRGVGKATNNVLHFRGSICAVMGVLPVEKINRNKGRPGPMKKIR